MEAAFAGEPLPEPAGGSSCTAMRFEELRDRYAWRAIRGCPGRYVLRGGGAVPGFVELAGRQGERFRVQGARDEVVVARLEDGSGVLSYERADGTVLHTLNTAEGLERKLRELGIELRDQAVRSSAE